jgi:PilZ domain
LLWNDRWPRSPGGSCAAQSPRERKNHVVRLEFDDGTPATGGTLSDLSATGARVLITNSDRVPVKLTLLFPDGTRRRCRLIWRSEASIGIEFVTA